MGPHHGEGGIVCDRDFWSYGLELIHDLHKISSEPTTFKSNGKTISDPKEVSNLFNDYFACIGEDMANSMPTVHGYEKYLNEIGIKNGFTLNPLAREGVESIMKNQKPKLLCGIDGINNRIVKECFKE